MSYSPDSQGNAHEDDLPLTAKVDDHPMRLAPDIADRLSPDEQAAYFSTLIDAAVDAMIAHRPDGTIIWANRGASELLGYSADEIMQLAPYGWVAPVHISKAPRRLETILTEGRLAFTSQVRRKDGSVVETEVSTRRVDTALGPVMISVIRDVSNWSDSKRMLEQNAYLDPLTGLANETYFAERLGGAIADARRFGDKLGLACLDLDDLKPVNTRLGREAGDAVLVELGRRLRDELRAQDTVARIGGDEFLMVLPRLSSHDELAGVAERLVARIEAPVQTRGQTAKITASLGLASFDHASDDGRSLLQKARCAMLAARRASSRAWLIYREGDTLPDGPWKP